MPRRRSFLPTEIGALRHAADRGGSLVLKSSDLEKTHFRYLLHTRLIQPSSITFDRPCPSWRLGTPEQDPAVPTHELTLSGWEESGRGDRRTDGFIRIVFRLDDRKRPWRELILQPASIGCLISRNGYRMKDGLTAPHSWDRIATIESAIRILARECAVDQMEFDDHGFVADTRYAHWHGRRIDLRAGTSASVALRLMASEWVPDADFETDLARMVEPWRRHALRPSSPASSPASPMEM